MKTSLRTYHPVPALQRHDENLQDAPRIKNLLKACALKTETDRLPVTQADLLALAVRRIHAFCSVVTSLKDSFAGEGHDPDLEHRQRSLRPFQQLHRTSSSLVPCLTLVNYPYSTIQLSSLPPDIGPRDLERSTRSFWSPRHRPTRLLPPNPRFLRLARSSLPVACLSLSSRASHFRPC